MSVLAWDGKTLAADKRVTSAGLARTTTKIFRFENCLLGITGNIDQGMEMIDWYRNGQNPKEFPASQRDKDDWALLVVVDKNGVGFYERTPFRCNVEDRIFAAGSGRDYALAAMHFGKSAFEAVAVASFFDVNCGNGIDELTLQ